MSDSNQPYTPYAPPTSNVEFTPVISGEFIPGGRSVSVGSGVDWISSAWSLFQQQYGLWLLFALVYALVYIALFMLMQAIPFVGLFLQCIFILLTAGVIYSCDRLQQEGSFTFSDLFVAFSRRTGSLLMICLLTFCYMIIMVIIFYFLFLIGAFLIGSSIGLFDFSLSSVESIISFIIIMIIGIIIMTICGFTLAMMLWFAPALVMMQNLSAFEAMKMSFSACLKNIFPGIIYFIVKGMLMIFLGMLTLGLGLLVLLPLFYICYYTSYRSVFFDENLTSPT